MRLDARPARQRTKGERERAHAALHAAHVEVGDRLAGAGVDARRAPPRVERHAAERRAEGQARGRARRRGRARGRDAQGEGPRAERPPEQPGGEREDARPPAAPRVRRDADVVSPWVSGTSFMSAMATPSSEKNATTSGSRAAAAARARGAAVRARVRVEARVPPRDAADDDDRQGRQERRPRPGAAVAPSTRRPAPRCPRARAGPAPRTAGRARGRRRGRPRRRAARGAPTARRWRRAGALVHAVDVDVAELVQARDEHVR